MNDNHPVYGTPDLIPTFTPDAIPARHECVDLTWPPIAPPVSFSAEAMAALLAVDADHQVREVEQGVYEHTLTPKITPTFDQVEDVAAILVERYLTGQSLTEGVTEGIKDWPFTWNWDTRSLFSTFVKRPDSREKRWRKIRRRQKRAAFRRRKRGLA